MAVVVFVPGGTPQVVDSSGRHAGGGEWIVVDERDPLTARMLAAGNLVKVDRPAGDMSEGAAVAFTALDLVNAGAAVPATSSGVADDEVRAMTAEAVLEHLDRYPGDVDRVRALEAARPDGPRKTVLRAIDQEGRA